MKHLPILKFATVLFFASIFHFPLMAQKVTEEKLLGCWKIKSVEFLQTNKDSLALINNIKGIITCFENNGKFTIKMKTGEKVEIVGTGTFNIDADGKTINQKRDADDNGVDEPAEIVKVSDQELSFKVSEMIFHFERIPIQ